MFPCVYACVCVCLVRLHMAITQITQHMVPMMSTLPFSVATTKAKHEPNSRHLYRFALCVRVCEEGVCVCAAQSFCLSVILMPLFRSALRQVTFLSPFSFRLLGFSFFFSQQAFYSFTFLISGDAAWVS